MRLIEKYERFGYFYKPSDMTTKVPGTLSISDGGEISLELRGDLSGRSMSFEVPDDIDRIIGELEQDGYVTLDGCLYKNRMLSIGGGFGSSSFHVHRAIIGLAYNEDEEPTFNEFSFSIEGLDEWLGITGISVDYQHESMEATIKFARPKEMSYRLQEDIELLIHFGFTLPGLPVLKKASISQRAYLTLRSEHARRVEEFIDIAHKIATLLCLATDATVSLTAVTASSDAIVRDFGEGITHPESVKVFYPSLPFSTKSADVSMQTMLFRFGHIESNAQDIVGRWIGAWDTFGPALGLYFSTVTGRTKTVDSKFLSLAQALEAFHRRTATMRVMDEAEFDALSITLMSACPEDRREWLTQRLAYANEVSLAARLKSIIEPFATMIGSSAKRQRFVRRIVDTRNYLTHYDDRLEKRAAKGSAMLHLCYAMEVIFQMHLLRTIGFTVQEVQTVIGGSYRLKQKLSLAVAD